MFEEKTLKGIYRRIASSMSGLGEINVEITPNSPPSWDPDTRTINMPPKIIGATNDEEHFTFGRGICCHEGSHIMFCPDLKSVNSELKEDTNLMDFINVFADLNNEYKLVQVYPHLKKHIVDAHLGFIKYKPDTLKTKSPFVQILLRAYKPMHEYDGIQWPDNYDPKLKTFIEETVLAFETERIKDCSGERLLQFSIEVWRKWKALLETRNVLQTSTGSGPLQGLTQDLAGLIKSGASKEAIAAKKAEIAKAHEKLVGNNEFCDVNDYDVTPSDIKPDSYGLASEEDIEIIQKKVQTQCEVSKQARLEMRPVKVIENEFSMRPAETHAPDPFYYDPVYDKHKATEQGRLLNRMLKRRVFLQQDYETKHQNGLINTSEVMRQVSRFGRLVSSRVFDRNNFYTRGGTWAVEVLCDCSGSMSYKMPNAKEALLTIGVALDGLPDVKYRLSGYCTDLFDIAGPIDILVKDYKNKRLKIHNIDCLGGDGGNIDGSNIRGALSRLMKSNCTKKLLMVISDGLPAGSCVPGLAPPEDVKTAVAFAEHHGVHVIGIGISGLKKPDVFKQMYPNHVLIDDCSELYKDLGGLMIECLKKN